MIRHVLLIRFKPDADRQAIAAVQAAFLAIPYKIEGVEAVEWGENTGHAYKVKLCLAVAGIAHDYEKVDIFSKRDSRSAEFRAHARFSEVPLLLDEDKAYVQSNAILIHIVTKHKLFDGEDKAVFERCVEWLFWEANKIGLCLSQLRASRKLAQFKLSETPSSG